MATMQTTSFVTSVEQMLESVDHLIEKHREGPALRRSFNYTPHVPEDWVLYSARYDLDGREKGWHVQFLHATKPFQIDSIIETWDSESLDTALRKAGDIASRSHP